MKKSGWILLAIWFPAVLLTTVLGRDNVWLLAIIGITFVVGSALLALSFAIRLYQGDVNIRPRDAAKKAIILFVIIMGLRSLAWTIFPSLDRNLAEALLGSAIFAIAYSLYVTAYRKPA